VEKYGRAREAVHDNTAHALGMLATRATHNIQHLLLFHGNNG